MIRYSLWETKFLFSSDELAVGEKEQEEEEKLNLRFWRPVNSQERNCSFASLSVGNWNLSVLIITIQASLFML